MLAKRIGFRFVDCDLLIQQQENRLLRDIIAGEGLDAFLEIEADVNASLNVSQSVISPGGSVCLRERAMLHLKEISYIIYLKISYHDMCRRIGDPVKRGVALRKGRTLRDMYEERAALYEEYADWIIDEEGLSAGEIVDRISERYEAGALQTKDS